MKIKPEFYGFFKALSAIGMVLLVFFGASVVMIGELTFIGFVLVLLIFIPVFLFTACLWFLQRKN